jgi:hypothetical protein
MSNKPTIGAPGVAVIPSSAALVASPMDTTHFEWHFTERSLIWPRRMMPCLSGNEAHASA